MVEMVSGTRVLKLIEHLESVVQNGSGVMQLRDREQELGLLVLDRGRLCWAACAAGRAALVADLCASFPTPRTKESLDAILKDAKSSTAGLVGRLVSEGIPENRLKSILEEHIARCVRHLAGAEGEWTWIPRSGQSYESRFSFSTATILVRAHGTSIEGATLTAVDMEDLVDDEMCGVAYRWGEWFTPLATAGRECPSLVFLADWGAWVERVVEAEGATVGNAGLTIAGGELGEQVLLWVERDIVYSILCENTHALGRAFVRRKRRLDAFR